MSRYVKNSTNKSKSGSFKKKITIASAQQAPLIVTDHDETAQIVSPNHDGGVSYDLGATFQNAVLKHDSATARSCIVALTERLATLGTCDTRVNINSTKLTDDARKTFYAMCAYDVTLVCQTLKSVYENDRAPKVSHVIYLVALLTSATKEESGNDQMMVSFRSKGYGMVPMFRITTHLFEWIHTHITLCSAHAQGVEDEKIENAPGLVLSSGRGRHGKSTKSKKPESKLARMGGTGAGFRRAVEAWYLNLCSTPENAMKLAIQITKYYNRHNFTHDDVLSLVHVKMTTKEKCKCKTKASCRCILVHPADLKNVVPVAGQVPLSYAVGGLDHAGKILMDGVDRLETHGGNAEVDVDIGHAFKVFAFLCAVEKAKKDETPVDQVCELIRIFRLTREMVSNTKLNDINVLNALTVKGRCTASEVTNAQRELLLAALPLHTLINKMFPEQDLVQSSAKNGGQLGMQIGMPITALVRNLNNLTAAGLFNMMTNPRSQELVRAIVSHLTNVDVLHAGHVHPINLFGAWAVYSRGKGHLGSKTWDPVSDINTALLDATEMAFNGLEGLDCSIAFLMDASGSMSQEGSAPGMPCLKALDIAVLLIMTLYRATTNYALKSGRVPPVHLVGYFGGSGPGYSANRSINKVITDSEITARASQFKEVTNKFNPKISFQDAKKALGDGAHLGMTDIGSAIWFLILKFKTALEQVKCNNPMYRDLTVHQLPGFAELLVLVTDNDVNSGDQPMDVLNLYWDLVRQAFVLLPFEKDGSKADPAGLFNKYVPRLVVVATQGTNSTVGDPRDSRILNISGFDSSAPTLIDMFVRKGQSAAPRTDDEGLDE